MYMCNKEMKLPKRDHTCERHVQRVNPVNTGNIYYTMTSVQSRYKTQATCSIMYSTFLKSIEIEYYKNNKVKVVYPRVHTTKSASTLECVDILM